MKTKLTMIYTTILVGVLLMGCGPSAKELNEKMTGNSIAIQDSVSRQQGIISELNLNTRTPDHKQFIMTAETKFLVNNVRVASERIEDLAAKYSGYITLSELKNQESDFSRNEISRDSVVISKMIVVENQIVLRVPNEKIDSLVREINKLILFLDYRTVKMDDISFTLLSNQKATERLKNYDARQKKHIDAKQNKLRETTNAEENVLNRQTQADNLQVENLALADQIKYCTLTLFIYQKPVLYKETQVQLNSDSFRAGFFSRVIEAMSEGWIMFEAFLVMIFRIWWLFVLALVGYFGYRLLSKPKKTKLFFVCLMKK